MYFLNPYYILCDIYCCISTVFIVVNGYIYIYIYIYIYVYMYVQWRRKVPKSGGAHIYVIYVPSVKNQYKRVVFGCMVIY